MWEKGVVQQTRWLYFNWLLLRICTISGEKARRLFFLLLSGVSGFMRVLNFEIKVPTATPEGLTKKKPATGFSNLDTTLLPTSFFFFFAFDLMEKTKAERENNQEKKKWTRTKPHVGLSLITSLCVLIVKIKEKYPNNTISLNVLLRFKNCHTKKKAQKI